MTYSRTIRTTVTSNGAAVVELIAGAVPIHVMEIGIALVNATASVLALGRPAAAGITPTTPVGLLLNESAVGTSRATLAAAWGTGPTIPAAYYRQTALPATAGAERIWSFEDGVFVPASGRLILWTLSVVSLADVYFVIEE